MVVVLGAGGGVGASTAKRFARDGYDVALVARDRGRLEALAAEVEREGATVGWANVDLADEDALDAAIRRFAGYADRLDVLVHNAVAFRPARALDLTADELLADVATGVAPLLTAVRAALPVMREQGGGTVLATGGGAADSPMLTAGSLGVQKAALRNLVRALAHDLAPDGVHVATVTVQGVIEPGTPFAPDAIAGVYADLAAETAGDRSAWRSVVDLTADGPVDVS